MAAYMIVNLQVTDPSSFKEFQEGFPPVLERFGGKYLARGGKAERWEGLWEPSRVIIFEFPSFDHAKGLYESKEYEPLKAIRMQSSKSDLIVVDGL